MFGVLLIVVGTSAGRRGSVNSVKGLAGDCACEVVAGLYHVWQVAPAVGCRVPGDGAGANGEVDVAPGKYPPTVVSSRSGRRAASRQVGNCSPGVRVRIVAPGIARRSIAAARVNVVVERGGHEGMVGKRVVCSHGARICGNIVYLDVKIGADSAAGDAIDLSVQVSTGMEVGRNGIGWQARVVGVADRVVPPKRGCRVEGLVHAAKQVDIGAVGCTAEPAPRLW